MKTITDSRPQVIHLSPEEFSQLSDRPRLIDVRSNFEYKLFHSIDAVNLSLTQRSD